MNILAINSIRFNNNNKQTLKAQQPRYGLVMTKPLMKDTVSFQATMKKLTNRGAGVSLKTARSIHVEADKLQQEIEDFVNKYFRDLLKSNEKPNNVIEYIKGRTKMPESIVEKSATRDWNSKAEVFTNMTDLNGVKIVLRDGSKSSVKQILKRLEKAISSGVLICTEVENKRPAAAKKLSAKEADKWDYASYETLYNFKKHAESESGKKMRFEPADYTDANYTAIHFLLRFPGQKRSFELQLMGRNIATFKDMDDIIFKILNNKNVDKAYQPMIDLLEPLKIEDEEDLIKMSTEQLKGLAEKIKDERNTPQRKEELQKRYNSIKENVEKAKKKIQISELFNKYRSEAFLFQREKAPSTHVRNKKEFFLPLMYDIPEDYDFNHLYDVYLTCAEKAARSKSKK